MRVILLFALFFASLSAASAQEIRRAEYFFDTDPGPGNGTPLSVAFPAYNVFLENNVTTSGLIAGNHILYIRTCTSDGIWSLSEGRAFTIVPSIIAAEYFVDTDPGVGNGTSISPGSVSDSLNWNFSFPTAGIAPGSHLLYVRTRSSAGVWSLSEGRAFTVVPSIIAAEYFVDTDPGVGNGTSISTGSVSDSLSWNFSFPTAGIAPGSHLLYVRTRSSAGVWSISEGRAFTIVPSIIAAEYFVDTDPGVGAGNTLTIATPADSVNTTFTIPTTGLPAGTHRLYIRTKNSEGVWSLSEPRIINLSTDPGLTVKLFIEGFYLGAGQMAAVLDPDNRPQVCDSITIALADTVPPYNILSSSSTVIYTDGSVQLVYPTEYFGRSYYVVIRHRNTIETWSKYPVSLRNNMVLFDFTTAPLF